VFRYLAGCVSRELQSYLPRYSALLVEGRFVESNGNKDKGKTGKVGLSKGYWLFSLLVMTGPPADSKPLRLLNRHCLMMISELYRSC